MALKIKKTYRFALITSLILSLSLTLVAGILLYLFDLFSLWPLLVLGAFFFVLCLIVVQYRVEQFIYREVKKMYDKVSLLDATSFQPKPITTDMTTLTREVEKFAETKKIEIEALEIKEAYRKEYLGNVSHELKTPLFMVQGYIHTLLDGAMKDKKVRKKYLQRASKGVNRLIYIVRDLDLISKLEAGDLDINKEKIDIVNIIQNVFEFLEMRAAKTDITLAFDREYDKPIYVMADRERLQQALSNLVVNSIKYGKKGGTTEVSIEKLTKKKIIVRVTDNGEGISKEHITRIFERFFRVDKSGSRKEGGSGLGLSIVKHIIEAHDEKIYVESRPGIGSEFSFTLEKA